MQTDRSIQTSSASNWRQAISDVGADALTTEGAVIVAMNGRGLVSTVSRVYALDEYDDSRKLRTIVWGRVTRLYNEDAAGTAYYVVWRYAGGKVIVYNGPDSMLLGG